MSGQFLGILLSRTKLRILLKFIGIDVQQKELLMLYIQKKNENNGVSDKNDATIFGNIYTNISIFANSLCKIKKTKICTSVEATSSESRTNVSKDLISGG